MKHVMKKLTLATCLSVSIAGSAQAVDLQANPLLAIDRNRAAVIEHVISQFKGNFAAGQEDVVRETLRSLRADHLLAASLAPNLDGLLAAITSADTGVGGSKVSTKNLGDSSVDLVYTPVTPCRLFDTRGSQGGLGTPLLNTRRTYGAITPVANQGGPGGGCAAGTGAAVALIQIGTLTPAGSGLLQGGAQGASLPNALILYQVGDQYGTAVAMPLNPANGRFDLQEQFAQADLYGDLLGYFRAPPNFAVSAVVRSSGTLERGDHVVSSANLSAGVYEVTFDQDVSGCTWTGTIGTRDTLSTFPGFITLAGHVGDVNGLSVSTYNTGGTSTNLPFHLNVTC